MRACVVCVRQAKAPKAVCLFLFQPTEKVYCAFYLTRDTHSLMILGKVLRAWRESEKLRVADAAAIAGIPPATFSRIENGKPVKSDTLAKLLLWLFSAKETG